VKNEWRVVIGAATFLAIVAVIYALWAPTIESASGAAMLIFSFCAYGLLGSYLILQWRRRDRLPRPEDRNDAEQSDGEGAVAFFPSASIWPAGIGLGVIITSLTFIWGNWYWFIGLPLVFGAIIGFVVESEHALDLELDVPEELKQHSTLGDTPPSSGASH
jgi:membrane associated rhomboid family serine protease